MIDLIVTSLRGNRKPSRSRGEGVPTRAPRHRSTSAPLNLLLAIALVLASLMPGGRISATIPRASLDPTPRGAVPLPSEETPSEEQHGERVEILCEAPSRRMGAVLPGTFESSRTRTTLARLGRQPSERDQRPGHFFTTGRALRYWIASQTC